MDDFAFEISFGFFCFVVLFAGKILLILLAFHLLSCFLHLFFLFFLMSRHQCFPNFTFLPAVVAPQPVFLFVDFSCEKKFALFSLRIFFGGVCVFFVAAAAAAVVVFKED